MVADESREVSLFVGNDSWCKPWQAVGVNEEEMEWSSKVQ